VSNFNHIPDDIIPLPSGAGIERVCQTCAHCTWDQGVKCLQPAVLGLERDAAMERGLSIGTAYRLCRGAYWTGQEFDE
jgi:hypothetical protein